MTEIRALMKRILYLSMNDIRSILLFNAAPALITLLCGISFRCGNLRLIYEMALEKYPDTQKNFEDIYAFLLIMLNSMVCLCCVSFDVSAVMKDHVCGWNRFAYTLPVSIKKYAAAYYILAVIGTVLTLVFIVILNLLCSVLFSQPFSLTPIAVCFALLMLMLTASRIFFNLVLRTGDAEKAKQLILYSIAISFLLLPAVFLFFALVLMPALGIEEDSLPELAASAGSFVIHNLWLFPAAVIIILYLSYRRTVILLERRIH